MENRISTLAFVIAVLGGIIVSYMNCSNPPSQGLVKTTDIAPLGTCTAEPLLASPVDAAKILNLVPLGSIQPATQVFPSPRLQFELIKEAGVPVSAKLLSPGNIRVLALARVQVLSPAPTSEEFEIYFQPCQDLQGILTRVQSLRSDLMALAGDFETGSCESVNTGGKSVRRCVRNVVAEFGVNAELGTIGGKAEASLFELGLRDARIPALAVANSDRFAKAANAFDDLHTACPLNFMVASLRTTLQALSARTSEPKCGSFNQDVAGTAKGRWFKQNLANLPQDPHLHIGEDVTDATKANLVTGTGITGLSGVHTYVPTATVSLRKNVRADLITADGEVYCFDSFAEAPGVSILLKLNSATELSIQKNTNASCGAPPYTLAAGYASFAR